MDLRHRLPELWQLILAGSVTAWRARKVAQATRHLSRDSAMQVDAAVARSITGLPWGRFETLLQAKIIEADPMAAEEQAKLWEARRFVRAGRTGQSGLKLLIAKANAGDVTWFMATVNRIAEILRLQGDMESADVRRSRAIGMWRSQRWRWRCCGSFRNEQHPAPEPQQPDEPIHNEPSPPVQPSTAAPDEERGEEPEVPAGRELIIQPPGVDPRKLRPEVRLYVHLSQEALLASTAGAEALAGGVGRLEGLGPITSDRSADSSATRPATSGCSR